MRLTSSVGEFSIVARIARPIGLLTLTLALAACGGGGGDGSAPATGSSSATPSSSTSNAPPSITGTPATAANAGQAYSFKPTATDPEGSKLTFSATGLPSWASFDAVTGKIAGTAVAGTYQNIVISVNDGTSTASLPAFSIKVAAASGGSGSATLSWAPPTTREDGSTLTNLSGYKIYYGTDQKDLSQVVNLNSAGLASYTIDGLTTGTYYFSLTAVDAAGGESPFSSVVSKTIG